MADRKARRLKRLAAVVRREAALARAAVRAYNRLLKATEELLAAHDYDTSVLDDRLSAWRDAVDEELVPEVTATYIAGLIEDAREGVTIDAQAYAVRYIASVHNRLVGVSEYAFDVMRTTLQEGVARGETIPELAARVNTVLTDEQRWSNRATVIARTEVVGAMNAGHEDAAGASADQLNVDRALVVKEWLATNDTRTRHTHREVDGAQVLGLAGKFHVGTSQMSRPGDPAGAADEVIQCRCSALYYLPGDLDYPENLTAGGSTMDAETRTRLEQLFDVSRMPPKLQAYWLGPEGAAKIGYGTPGQFKRCQSALRGKVPGRMIDGTCANLIHKATGQWPGKHAAATELYEGGMLTWDAALAQITGKAVTAAADGDSPMVEPPPGAYPDDYEPTDPEDEEPDTGLWIGVLPAADEDVHGIGPEEKHATMFFLGEATQFTDQDHTDLATLLQAWAATCPPITSAVTGMDRLGRDPENEALVWLLDDELAGPREALATTPLLTRLLEVAADLQFPDYLPHSTVGYPDSQTDDVDDAAWPAIEDAAADVTSIRFDRIAMWWGDDRSAEWPLTGAADTPAPEPVTAALSWDDALRVLTAAAPEGDGIEELPGEDDRSEVDECTCCGGVGEHTCGHECYVCDAGMTREAQSEGSAGLEPGDAIVCEGHHGRPDPCDDGRQGSECEHDSDPVSPDTPPDGTPVVPEPQQEDDAAMSAAATEQQIAAEAATDTTLTWTGVLCPEGIATGDKRKFADGAILWMEDPGVLKAMFADKPGHDDSVPVGLITSIERVDGKLPFSGTWSTGEEAEKARQWNIDGRLRGVSVDLDDVEMHLEDDAGNVIEGDAIWELESEPVLVVDKGRVRAATLWCTPAYVEAYVLDATVADQLPKTKIVDATGVTPLGLAAAAAMADRSTTLPTAAPSNVFANPGLTEPTCFTLLDDGRFFAHLATWGTCHIGIDGACVTPPESHTDYAYMCTGMYQCSDGEVIPVGTLTMGTGHATLELGWRPTVDHYDDTGTAAGWFNIGEDPIGIWMAGVIDPNLPDPQRLALQRSGSVSGDWRDIGGHLELVAALAVNVPGFPIPRVQQRIAAVAAAAGSQVRPLALVASGVVRHTDTPVRLPSVAELAREVAAYQVRQSRLDATRRRLRKSRQHHLAGRIRKG